MIIAIRILSLISIAIVIATTGYYHSCLVHGTEGAASPEQLDRARPVVGSRPQRCEELMLAILYIYIYNVYNTIYIYIYDII